jgi:iron complex outermembrane receptor protein
MYASATRGFKSGGWNARGTTPDQIQPFRPEKIWSYELGLRSELIERTLRMNLTAFWGTSGQFRVIDCMWIPEQSAVHVAAADLR